MNKRYESVIDKLVGIQPKSSALSGKLAEVRPKLSEKLVLMQPKPSAASGPLRQPSENVASQTLQKIKTVKGK